MRETGAEEKRFLPSPSRKLSSRTGITYLSVTEQPKRGRISRDLLCFLCGFFHPAMHKVLLEAGALWSFLAF